jgi:hypothetical protein
MNSNFKIQNFRKLTEGKKVIALQTLRGQMKTLLTCNISTRQDHARHFVRLVPGRDSRQQGGFFDSVH